MSKTDYASCQKVFLALGQIAAKETIRNAWRKCEGVNEVKTMSWTGKHKPGHEWLEDAVVLGNKAMRKDDIPQAGQTMALVDGCSAVSGIANNFCSVSDKVSLVQVLLEDMQNMTQQKMMGYVEEEKLRRELQEEVCQQKWIEQSPDMDGKPIAKPLWKENINQVEEMLKDSEKDAIARTISEEKEKRWRVYQRDLAFEIGSIQTQLTEILASLDDSQA